MGAELVQRCMKELTESDWELRLNAAKLLGCMDRDAAPAIPALIEALHDEVWFIRLEVASTLAHIEADAKVISALIEALKDPEIHVRSQVAALLGDIPEAKAAIPALIESLNDPERDVRSSAAFALGSHGDTAVISALARALKDPDCIVRMNAAWSLRRISPILRITGAKSAYVPIQSDAVPALIGLLKDADWSVRARAAMFLGSIDLTVPEIGIEKAVLSLTESQRDSNYLVRKQASKSLQRIRLRHHR